MSQQHDPRVLPPQSHPYGRTYGEWSAAWWQWAYSIPVPTNPLFDKTGANCGEGQSGHVWFLAGMYNLSGVAERTCTIPAGTALFFPILNIECDNFFPPHDPPKTVTELRELCQRQIDAATGLSVTVDGKPLQVLESYRVSSPVFNVTLPDTNIPQSFEIDAPAEEYSDVVADGYYLMLAPLPAGQHTIHFTGSVPDVFAQDITYHITVAG